MTKRWIQAGIAGVLLLSSLVFASCSNEPDKTTAAPEFTSDQLEAAIEGRFAQMPGLSDVDVSADAEENTVTLTGKVATQSLRTEALNAAHAVSANLVVTDRIDVRPRDVPRNEYTEEMAREARTRAESFGDKVGTTLDDAWIHTKITTQLFGDSDTPGRSINVDVENGAVTLRGTVADATAKTEAGRIAKETEGVKRVQNTLKVQPN
jgi:osmotically-inducible protein OsmY